MATLKHAFTAKNIHALMVRIVQGKVRGMVPLSDGGCRTVGVLCRVSMCVTVDEGVCVVDEDVWVCSMYVGVCVCRVSLLGCFAE